MRMGLLFADHDLEAEGTPLGGVDAAVVAEVVADLGLEHLIAAMAGGEELLSQAAQRVLLEPLTDPAAVRYRQDVVADALALPRTVRELFSLADETLKAERKVLGWWGSGDPSLLLHRGIEVAQLLVPALRSVRRTVLQERATYRSEGFRALAERAERELTEDWFSRVHEQLHALQFRPGVRVGFGLAWDGHLDAPVLRAPEPHRRTLGEVASELFHPADAFHIDARDEAGGRALGLAKGRGINLVADALTRSNDHLLGFLRRLRAETAALLAAVRWHEELVRRGLPVCRPEVMDAAGAGAAMPDAAGSGAARDGGSGAPEDGGPSAAPVPGRGPGLCEARGLCDAALALSAGRDVVGNAVEAAATPLLVVTGANRGGKSTLLRSLGQAQLLTQAGFEVPAQRFAVPLGAAVFTHFKREEDAGLRSGKFDEELRRMSRIVDHVHPGDLVLLNEPFAATNEREGAAVARGVIEALLETGVRVAVVTHQYSLATQLRGSGACYLRAGRERSFRLEPGEPLATSYGADLFERIFGAALPGAETRGAPQGEPGA